MKQPVKCGNSSAAAAAGTQKQYYYGLCLRDEVAKKNPKKQLASTLSKHWSVSVPCADNPVLGFPKLKAQCLRVLTRSGETNPFVVRAVRRQIHSFILGADK